ncbi:MAG: hypothetical protein WBN22_08690 [Verrucomicrobiia bacterium]
MKIARKRFQQSARGYALLITVVFIGIALLLLGSVMNWSNSTAKQTERNNLFSMSTGAAEAATEKIVAQMTCDFFAMNFASSANYYMINSKSQLPVTTGWPVQFSFSNALNSSYPTYVSINPVNWTTNWSNLFSSNYANLHAYVAYCTVASTATTSNQPYNVSATVQQTFQLASIPLFQYAAFYNMNMEIDPGATMTLSGPVFSDAGLWTRGPITYGSSVSAVGFVSSNTADPWLTSKTDTNTPSFNSTINSNQDTMAMPIGTTNNPAAIQALLGLSPSGTAPYSSTGQLYFVNEAALVISNSSSGTISAFLQDSNNTPSLKYIQGDVVTSYLVTNGYTTNKTTHVVTPITSTLYNTNYSFATNTTFYDYREKKTVQAVQLNVGALNTWITSTNGSTLNTQLYSDTGSYIDSVYVYNNAPSSSSVLPSVRVANGAVLPSNGLTVVTPDPLYVLGSYNASGVSLNNGTNVSNTLPAALMGDSITALSPNWHDNYTASTNISSRTATADTINAATFEGIVPTAGSNYSGGLENFIRLLENWSSVNLTYNGSIVVMFPSQYATNAWPGTGTIYNAPVRKWAFDLNFMQQNGLPPLTPRITAICRTSWSVY